MVSRARCQRSWWSTSATDAPNRFWSCALADLTNFRFPFSDPASGKCNCTESMPTEPAPPPAASGCPRHRRDFGQLGPLDLPRDVALEDVAFLHVVETVEQDAA